MKRLVERHTSLAMDGVMCAMMNALQWRRGLRCTRREMEDYLEACGALTREEFYAPAPPPVVQESGGWLTWDSPVASGFPENDRVRVRCFPGPQGPGAPTVVLLHALMSANDFGYRKLARWFNDRGWNAVFPHLPFHYSRTPRGYLNGELAITAHLIRNAETLRQGVRELRQLLALLRARGCREFGLIGTSLGGWKGALLSFLEGDFRFLSLIQPIVDVEHAIWGSPGSRTMRRILQAEDIGRHLSERHGFLSSPLQGSPLCGAGRVILTSGLYDTVSPPEALRELHRRWTGSTLIEVPQGHFGHTALRETLRVIAPRIEA